MENSRRNNLWNILGQAICGFRKRRDLETMLRLDSRILDDIGVTRFDIESAIEEGECSAMGNQSRSKAALATKEFKAVGSKLHQAANDSRTSSLAA